MQNEISPAQQLRNAIREAFLHVSYPGDDKLLAEDSSDELELADLKMQSFNSAWTMVPASVIYWHYDSLPFFGAEAFCFYLPAYLTVALGEGEFDPGNVLDFLVYTLDNIAIGLTRTAEQRDVYDSILALLTRQQRLVIVQFLEFVRDVLRPAGSREEAAHALEVFWNSVRVAK